MRTGFRLAFALITMPCVLSLGSEWFHECRTSHPSAGHHEPPFEIGCWGDDGAHLEGFFAYAMGFRHPDDPPPTTLHGKHDGDAFRPNVTFQIGRSSDGPWKTIGRLHTGDDALTVDPSKGAFGLYIQLDAFRPHLRKIQHGRVVLESGEAATIDLDHLLPEKERPQRGHE